MNLILTLEQTVASWLLRDYRQRALRRAALRAYRTFVRQNPHWQEVLFDEHFLTHRAVSVLQPYTQGCAPDPAALAQAWAEQWGFQDKARAAFVATLMPAAVRFLHLLEHEWQLAEGVI